MSKPDEHEPVKARISEGSGDEWGERLPGGHDASPHRHWACLATIRQNEKMMRHIKSRAHSPVGAIFSV